MPIFTITLSCVLLLASQSPVELTLDFEAVTTGVEYKIDIAVFDRKGNQKGKTQSPILGAAAGVDDVIRFFHTNMSNRGLIATQLEGTKRVRIVGPRGEFGRIEYSTFTMMDSKWAPNAKLKGPTIVGKPVPGSPSFAVNPKQL